MPPYLRFPLPASKSEGRSPSPPNPPSLSVSLSPATLAHLRGSPLPAGRPRRPGCCPPGRAAPAAARLVAPSPGGPPAWPAAVRRAASPPTPPPLRPCPRRPRARLRHPRSLFLRVSISLAHPLRGLEPATAAPALVFATAAPATSAGAAAASFNLESIGSTQSEGSSRKGERFGGNCRQDPPEAPAGGQRRGAKPRRHSTCLDPRATTGKRPCLGGHSRS